MTEAVAGSVRKILGDVRVASMMPIGADFGFEGATYRVTLDDGSTVVAKVTSVANADAEMRARTMTEPIRTAVPRLLGVHGVDDSVDDQCVIVMEDIADAVQGDVLAGCSLEGAATLLRHLGTLHAAHWSAAGARPEPRWARPIRWDAVVEAISTVARRYPDFADRRVQQWLLEVLPGVVDAALVRLDAGPHTWIHGDMHLDNVLWRGPADPAILDWTHSVWGPPAVDIVWLTDGGGLRRDVDLRPYLDILEAARIDLDPVLSSLDDAALRLLAGRVGWAGLDPPRSTSGRFIALRDDAAARALAEIRRRL